MANRQGGIDFLVADTAIDFVITTRSIEELLHKDIPHHLQQGMSVLGRFEIAYTYKHEDSPFHASRIAELERGGFLLPADEIEAAVGMFYQGAKGLCDYRVVATAGQEPGTVRLSIHGTVYGTQK